MACWRRSTPWPRSRRLALPTGHADSGVHHGGGDRPAVAHSSARRRPARSSCVPLSVWTYPQDSAYAVSGPFRRAGQIVDYFSGLIGPFPYPSLAHVESSTRFGGMENATAIFYDEKRYRHAEPGRAGGGARDGAPVVRRRGHRGRLASPLAVRGVRDLPRRALAAPCRRRQRFPRRTCGRTPTTVLRAPRTPASRSWTPTATDLLGLLNSNNYQKGAWVLHQLRGLMGDSAFYRGASQLLPDLS